MVFRHIFRQWFNAQTREALRRKVQEAAAEELAADQETLASESADDPACEVGIVFALPIEAGGLVDLLERCVTVRPKNFTVQRGMLRSRRVAVVTAGAGQTRAARAADALIDAHSPRWIISAGFAGGLSAEIKRGDIVMADSLVDTDGRPLDLDLRVDPASLAKGVHVGRLLTVDKVVRLPERKRELGERFAAMAVDTETMAVARVCRQRHVPLLAIRVLTDAVDETLPADIQHLTDQTSTAGQLGAALGTVWRRPTSVKDLWALKETALIGSDRLARFLAGVIETLAPLPPATRE